MVKVAVMAECIQEKMDGQAWFTYHLAKNLAEIGDIDLTLIGGDYLNKIDIDADKLIFKRRIFTRKIFCIDVLKKINSEDFDIIHSPVNYGLPYFYFTNAKKVKTVHGAAGFELKFRYPFVHKVQLKIQLEILKNKIDKIVTISNTSKEEIIKHFHFSPQEITVIYNGVGEEFRVIEKEDCKKVLKKYGVKMPYIFHVSNASPIKNIPAIINAFQMIKDKINCNLVIGGGWSGGSNNRIISVGYISFEDLPFFYAGAEIFVFPSFHEGFGLPVLEAMASGTPVITSNIYATKEIADDAAILVNPYNVSEIADAIYALLNDIDLYEEIREKGLKRVREFSWKKCAKEYVRLYKETMKEDR